MSRHRLKHAKSSAEPPQPVQASGESRCHYYRIAGRLLLSERVITTLQSPESAGSPPWKCGDSAADFDELPILRRYGWAGDQRVEVSCAACSGDTAGYRLTIDGAGVLRISADGGLIEEPSGRQLDPALLGPALVLALALHGTWCLHASAVSHSGRLIAFIGEAGVGKSTMARSLDSMGSRAGWRRVADDILPVSNDPAGPVALPHFPQPALAPNEQYDGSDPERQPLVAVYQLMAGEELTRHHDIAIEPMGEREALVALVQHTLGAGLFGRQLLARHLASCAELVAGVPVRRLWYPRRHELLPQVATALIRDLEQHSGKLQSG